MAKFKVGRFRVGDSVIVDYLTYFKATGTVVATYPIFDGVSVEYKEIITNIYTETSPKADTWSIEAVYLDYRDMFIKKYL